MKKNIVWALMGCLILPSLAAQTLEFKRSLTADPIDTTTVEIVAGAGKLEVIGSDAGDIQIEATVVSKDYSEMAEFVEVFDTRMLFYTKQVNGTTQIMAKARKSMYNTPNIQINLQIRVPAHLNLLVDDGSGSLQVSDLTGSLEIDDESGSMKVHNIKNTVTIKDGSGSVLLEAITGDVQINDKAGSIELRTVQGDVLIEDGSGSIYITNMMGNLSVNDGSGDVQVKGLKGNFKLLDDGSGKVVVNGQTWALK